MAWIRSTTEPPARRPVDIARLAVGGVGVAVAGVWAQTSSSIDVNLFRVVNDLPNGLDGLGRALNALGSIWAVAAVALAFLAFRHTNVALRAALAGAGAWGVAQILNEILGDHSSQGIHVRTSVHPAFPSSSVAVAVALALVCAPYVVRPLRRLSVLAVVAVGFAVMFLGSAYPSDVLGGLLLGFATAGATLVALGSPAGRPTLQEVRDSLDGLGLGVTSLDYATDAHPHNTALDAVLTDRTKVRIEAFGRDERDAQITARLWRRLMYREPGHAVFGSRTQEVEHIAYALLWAARSGVSAPRLELTGASTPETAILVTTPPSGTRFGDAPPEVITDEVVAAAWTQLIRLHGAGISHGNVDPHRVLITDEGEVALDDFSSADATKAPYWLDRDDAALLVMTAASLGNDRAIKVAVDALGADRVAAIIPMVQPAALPRGVFDGSQHAGKALKALRADMAAATGAEDVQPLKVRRLSLTNIAMLAGVLIALSIAISSLEGVNFSSVKSEFENATWGWVVAAAMLYPLIITSWATALIGCVNQDLPFVPTVLVQLACSFLNLVTPNGIGGTALQIDYLKRQGVPIASGGSAMVLSTGVGGLIQMILFLTAVSLTATTIDTGGSGGSKSLGVIAVVAAAIGALLLIPKIRGKVVPAVKRAASDIWAVIRNPKKAMQLIGGDLGGNLLYPAALGLCLLAFGQSLGFAQLVVVQVGAGMLGSVAPVPGGVGVQEAALTAGLTSFGVPNAPALAAVLVFRAITFALPPIFGFFTLRWLRKKGYA